MRKSFAIPNEHRYRCRICKVSFSVTAGSMFHKTQVDLQKWFFAIPLVVRNRISGRSLARTINVTKDTACYMINRIIIANKEQPELIKNFMKLKL